MSTDEADLPSEAEIDENLQADCVQTVNTLTERGGWNLVSIPQSAEKELQSAAEQYGLEDDAQTRRFCQFMALATNFASLQFVERVQLIPELVGSIKALLAEIYKEMQEIAHMGSMFEEIVQCFTSLVLTTQHNMKMMLPNLQLAVEYIDIVVDALTSSGEEPLSGEDRCDVEKALKGMSSGIEVLLKLSEESRDESEKLAQRINTIKDTVQNKQVVVRGRIHFGQAIKYSGEIIASLGSCRAAANNMNCLRNLPGIVRIGSYIYPSLQPLILAVIVGGVAVASIKMLVEHFWLNRNYRALDILQQLLDHLIRLSEANAHFTDYMRCSKANAHTVLVNVKELQENITTSSHRFRMMNIAVSARAASTTRDMIKTIEEILAIRMDNLIANKIPLNMERNRAIESGLP